MNLRTTKRRLGTVAIFCFSFLINFQAAHSQTAQDAESAYSVGHVDLAAAIALRAYNNGGDLYALELHCRYASASGNVRDALPYSETLFRKSRNWRHAAEHVRRLAFAGEPIKARAWANWVKLNTNDYRQDLDCALERDYKIRFEIRPSVLVTQQTQTSLAPFYQIPIPLTNQPWQQSVYAVKDANAILVGSGSERFLEVSPSVNSSGEVGDFSVYCNFTLSPYDCRRDCAAARWGYPASLQPFLAETESINYGHRSIEALAKTLLGKTPFETVNNVCDFGSKNIFYVPNGFNGDGSASDILARGYGHCASRTALMVALLRKNAIPARALRGHSMMRGNARPGGVSGFHHSILEFYLDGVGWIPWDFNQTPGCVIPDFLALWAYQKSIFDSGPRESTYHLNWIQRLGIGVFPDSYDYARFGLVRRHW